MVHLGYRTSTTSQSTADKWPGNAPYLEWDIAIILLYISGLKRPGPKKDNITIKYSWGLNTRIDVMLINEAPREGRLIPVASIVSRPT